MSRNLLRAGAALLAFASSPMAFAQSEAEKFYADKALTMVVGYGPGGGYDVYARLVARHLSRYIPGGKAITVQNMPGAGSLRAAAFLYTTAPKDGTFVGTFSREMPLAAMLGGNPNINFDPRKFTWLGSPSSFATDAYILWVRKDSAIKSIEQARGPGVGELILGGTAEGASGNDTAVLLRDVLKLRMKLITGYPDSNALFLATDRKEIEGRFVGLSAVASSKPDWLKPDSVVQPLLQFGRERRHPDFANVPTARELAGDERARMLIEFAELPYLLSRPFVAPPGVPADRAKLLQKAFMDATKDKMFLEESERVKVEVSPVGADEAVAMLEKVAAAPEDVKAAVRALSGHK
jgi:tripartite-type tricarboxylate transporter receptor subunit TctC